MCLSFFLSFPMFQSTLPHGERLRIILIVRNWSQFQSTLPHGERLCLRHHRKGFQKFQSTLPHGERPALFPDDAPAPMFQSTLPHGERPPGYVFQARRPKFQSTLPHGERRFGSKLECPRVCFNPRSRTGSDRSLREICLLCTEFQSTLPHGERPLTAYHSERHSCVSIHAPARGATCSGFAGRIYDSQFQSTLPHGERLLALQVASTIASFNPRSRTGSDVPFRSHAPRFFVSIHAPARGATRRLVGCRRRLAVSIHAPARGATVGGDLTDNYEISFNPRSRTGSDCASAATGAGFWCFNPRSRTGSDVVKTLQDGVGTSFNPRSRTGSDCDFFKPCHIRPQ